MNLTKSLFVLVILAVAGFGYFLFSQNKQVVNKPNLLPSITPAPTAQEIISPTPYPDTQSAIAAFLANKYKKPVSEVKVTIDKEVQGFAAGSVLFGQGGPGEGGMWLAVLGKGWEVVWDGNGNVDCDKMRKQYGFPDTILKPNFCN
ncbi:MAG: hypothetical protein M1365_07795 [Actinobacteria bacterium]|nr:hypothetical protein [Actinomycetota bacterium]